MSRLEEVGVEKIAGFPNGAADKSEILLKISPLREMLRNANMPAASEPMRHEAERDRLMQ